MTQPAFPQQTSASVDMVAAFGILKEMDNASYCFNEKVTPQGKVPDMCVDGELLTHELEAALILMLMYDPKATRLMDHPLLPQHSGDFENDPIMDRLGVSYKQAEDFLQEYAVVKQTSFSDWYAGFSASKGGRSWITNVTEPVVLEAILTMLYGYCQSRQYKPTHCEEVV